MLKRLNFQNWINEYADYGFTDLSSKILNKKSSKFKQNTSNIMFEVDLFLDSLTQILDSEGKKIIRKWAEEIFWEDNGHLMETNVNPFGSLRITTRKYINDLSGNLIPLCKDLFDIDETHFGKENLVAEVIHKRIKKIRNHNFDFPEKEYENLEKLSVDLYKHCLHEYPSYIMFPVGLKKINKYYYKIFFEFKGAGTGAPSGRRAEQFNIDIAFDKEKGLIKCWGYDISSSMSQREFSPQPSEWYEYFSPREDKNTIIRCIIKTLATY